MSNAIPIGGLSRMTGVKVPTIRYYESVGLMPEPPRTEGNRRLYGPRAVDRLRFIRHARAWGSRSRPSASYLNYPTSQKGRVPRQIPSRDGTWPRSRAA